ncbi:MAG: hypothetical protein ABFQ62_01015 [Patescibacteria group bacterium]
MFDSRQFIGAKKPTKQSASRSLHSRVNPEEQPIPQEDYEKQVEAQQDQSENQVWTQVKVAPQSQPVSNLSDSSSSINDSSKQPPPEIRDLPAGRQGESGSRLGQDQMDEAESVSNDEDNDERDYFEHLPKPLPEETLLIWKSASRPFKKRNRQFYTTIATIVVLISLILFFAGQFLPIAVVISIAFLAYVLSSVPPHEDEKKITTYGVRVDKELYYWEEMGRFWFDEKYGSKILHVEIVRFPGRLTLLLGDLKEEELEDLLKEVLIKQKPEDTLFDKSATWLQEKIPLDTA